MKHQSFVDLRTWTNGCFPEHAQQYPHPLWIQLPLNILLYESLPSRREEWGKW